MPCFDNRKAFRLTQRLILMLVVTIAHMVVCLSAELRAAEPQLADRWIGYTELQTNLAGGRHANVRTMRAVISRADGTDRRIIAEHLIDYPDAWTQFTGWSPDGKSIIINRCWESSENAHWEEEHKTFRFQSDGWHLDSYLVDLATSQAVNLTSVERVSFYNSGVFFWPKNPNRLGFTALIDGQSHPFSMDLDGRHKIDLNDGKSEFTYGFSTSRDGRRIAYHKNYQVYIADADGSNSRLITTGNAFNFVPTWSPDGTWLMFVSGEHYNCHPYLVRLDGTDLHKLADRKGYRGVMEFLDVPDFHNGSSDIPVWSSDGQTVFYTAKVGSSVELFQTTLDGKSTQLTRSTSSAHHYHLQPSSDGRWLAYGAMRNGVRQLYIRDLVDGTELPVTKHSAGHAAMWMHWQPSTTAQ